MKTKKYSITFTSKAGRTFIKEYRTSNKRELFHLIRDYRNTFDVKTVVYSEIKR